MMKRPDIPAKYAGKWIALDSDGQVIASGETIKEVLAATETDRSKGGICYTYVPTGYITEATTTVRSASEGPVSDLFANLVCHGSSNGINCELCGRVHFSEEGDHEKGELERLREKAKEHPDRFTEDSDFTPWGTIDGLQAVIDCPCNGLAKYERFIWDHRYLIMKYLKKRIEAELKEKQAEKAVVDSVPIGKETP